MGNNSDITTMSWHEVHPGLVLIRFRTSQLWNLNSPEYPCTYNTAYWKQRHASMGTELSGDTGKQHKMKC